MKARLRPMQATTSETVPFELRFFSAADLLEFSATMQLPSRGKPLLGDAGPFFRNSGTFRRVAGATTAQRVPMGTKEVSNLPLPPPPNPSAPTGAPPVPPPLPPC